MQFDGRMTDTAFDWQTIRDPWLQTRSARHTVEPLQQFVQPAWYIFAALIKNDAKKIRARINKLPFRPQCCAAVGPFCFEY
jgi:hypothetical protein